MVILVTLRALSESIHLCLLSFFILYLQQAYDSSFRLFVAYILRGYWTVCASCAIRFVVNLMKIKYTWRLMSLLIFFKAHISKCIFVVKSSQRVIWLKWIVFISIDVMVSIENALETIQMRIPKISIFFFCMIKRNQISVYMKTEKKIIFLLLDEIK